jgi:vacuolar-type H+-ATPase subunit E/Vma4
MALEDILARIRKDSEAEASRILRSARNESVKMRHRHAGELQDFEARERALHENRQAEMENVYLADAHRTARQIKLNTEEELIDRCFKELENRLSALEGERYHKSLEELISSGLKLQPGNTTIRAVRNSDISLIENMLPGLGSASSKQVVIDRNLLPQDCLGGVQLVSEDGKTIVDNTFKAILARNRDAYRIEIAGILFGEG